MKGIARSERVWRVDGLRLEARKQFVASDAPIVGRTAQLSALIRLWRECRHGGLRSVLVLGDPGIGKSRLVSEMLAHAELGREAALLELHCSPFHKDEPLFPVLDQLRRSISTDGGVVSAGTLKTDVTDADQQGWVAARELVALLSGEPDVQLVGLTARGRKEKAFGVLQSMFDTISMFRTLLLVVEDLHWADATTIEFLHRFILLSFQTERFCRVYLSERRCRPRVSDIRFDEVIDVPRLSSEEVDELIQAIAGSAKLPRSAREAIAERSDGVPLYVEELAKAVLGGDLLYETRQPVAITRAERDTQRSVPMTLHDSLIARIDRLPIKMEIAQAAAAIGRDFSSNILRIVLGYRGHEVEHGLRLLVDAQILKADRTRSGYFTFKHSLMRDAVYEVCLCRRLERLST